MFRRVRDGVTIVSCGGMAWAASLLLREKPIAAAVPLMFLLVIIPVTQYCGTLSGILTALVVGGVFSIFLFPPFGSPLMQYRADWINLILFEFIAAGIAYLSSKPIPAE
jgi:K+-sensing histidine kinase KdpD